MQIADLSAITARCQAASCHLLRLRTDTGQTSFGEAVVEGLGQLLDAVELFGPVLIGEDVRDRGQLWERMVQALMAQKWPLSEYIGALSGLDMSLWDLAAQAYDVPLYQLLGGAYFSAVDTYLIQPDGLSNSTELLSWLADCGEYAAGGVGLTVASGGARDLATVDQIRKQADQNRRLVVRLEESYPDCASAEVVAQQLMKAEVFWGENILPITACEEYAKLRNSTDLPLAAGRDLYGIKQFYRLIRAQAVDVVTVDLRRCGGITVGQRVADLARLEGMRVALVGGVLPLTTLSAAHLSANCPVAMPLGLPAHFPETIGKLLSTPAELTEGFLHLGEAPGVGGELKLDGWEFVSYEEELNERAGGQS